ncbi:MAG: hypothetical protein PHG13_00915 [Candidatus Pacebacteria bacterium]|jgi:hypothetical protein|nr:hypothetical protein [Candidatus Paceibacterota bacterium]MDD5721954.1 hypothetical protein [Candidatus Paceibacterota bacterium]
MKKKFIYTVLLIGVAIAGVTIFLTIQSKQEEIIEIDDRSNPLSITYTINGSEVRLKDGYAEEAIPNSASKILTVYFGNDLVTDLNGDGLEDIVFFITQQTGGTGTFYYVVAAVNSEDGYIGSNAYFIGDRIAPQAIEEIGGGVIEVNYAERAEDEPMTAQPSISKSIFLKLNENNEWFSVESYRSHPADREEE